MSDLDSDGDPSGAFQNRENMKAAPAKGSFPRLDAELKALRCNIFSPPDSKSYALPTRGSLAEPTPEWAKPIKKRSSEECLEAIIGLTLNGPRVPPPEPDRSLSEALRAIVELRDGIARCEGERQARLQRQTLAEDRRTAIKMILTKKGWSLAEPGIADALAAEIKNDPLFKDKDGKLLFPVSRRTITRDLPLIS